jgi:hypothetical protein
MDRFAGLDVSLKASVCIVDDTGNLVREVTVASEPEGRRRRLPNQGIFGPPETSLRPFT